VDRAEYALDEHGVDRTVRDRQVLRSAIDDVDRQRQPVGGALGHASQIGLGLDSDQVLDRLGNVLEVDAVSGSDLDHPSGEAREHLAAQRVLSPPLVLRGEAVE
jgi:hypothetical protein